jgi:uncharacterized membrane protein YqjE
MAVSAEELGAQRRREELRATIEEENAAASFGTSLSNVWNSARRLVHGYALLAVLDMRRAAVQLAWLIAAGVIISVLVVTAWLTSMSALVIWLLGQQLPWPAILLIAAALNLIGAVLLVWRLRSLLRELPFAATLRQIKGDPAKAPAAANPDAGTQ